MGAEGRCSNQGTAPLNDPTCASSGTGRPAHGSDAAARRFSSQPHPRHPARPRTGPSPIRAGCLRYIQTRLGWATPLSTWGKAVFTGIRAYAAPKHPEGGADRRSQGRDPPRAGRAHIHSFLAIQFPLLHRRRFRVHRATDRPRSRPRPPSQLTPLARAITVIQAPAATRRPVRTHEHWPRR